MHEAAVPDAEVAKTADVAAGLWADAGAARLHPLGCRRRRRRRHVTDLAGFVAATWLRGIAVVHVPTTLLAMVDAAVGGKTGINTAEGKNLVGAFHPPAGVLCDLDVLSTLPRADFVAGLAEVVKAGFIADPVILDLIEADPSARHPLGRPEHPRARRARRRRQGRGRGAGPHASRGLREILNYGHTFGHAVEQVEGYRRRHGEAVAIGMMFAAELGLRSGHLGGRRRGAPPVGPDHARAAHDLPRGSLDQLLGVMRRDKKARGDLLRFVVLEDIGPARCASRAPTRPGCVARSRPSPAERPRARARCTRAGAIGSCDPHPLAGVTRARGRAPVAPT